MSEATRIILNLLWRFYPIAWLTTAIVRALARITSWLEDEESLSQLSCEPEDCACVGGWLALAEERLNELIVWKAMKLLKRPFYPSRPCGHHMARAVRTPQEIYRRLCRLIVLYHDHKRLYELRARKLERLFAKAELQLEVIHHPVESQPAAAGAGCGGGCGDESHFPAPHSAQPIRAPPHRRTTDNQACPTRRPHRRERGIVSAKNTNVGCISEAQGAIAPHAPQVHFGRWPQCTLRGPLVETSAGLRPAAPSVSALRADPPPPPSAVEDDAAAEAPSW